MTQEEMIKNKAKEYAYKNYEQGGNSDTWEDIYTDGAEYGYQLAVDKACEWLKSVMIDDDIYGVGDNIDNLKELINDFKKSMNDELQQKQPSQGRNRV